MDYTTSQKQRLLDLSASKSDLEREFEDAESRDKEFFAIERDLIKSNKQRLRQLLSDKQLPDSLKIRSNLEKWLINKEGFTEVTTPIIITADSLNKMNLKEDSHLWEQIYWVDKNKCLRPMHAPNLYEMMRDIHKITNGAVRIFEVGSCFRKESQGAHHNNEFTMLNLVELAAGPDGYQTDRLRALAEGAMAATGLEGYSIVTRDSGVYGTTVDIEYDGIEIASGAFGPHPLDANWGIFDTWVGIGIGIERLAMVMGGHNTIKPVSKSVNYIDGISLRLK